MQRVRDYMLDPPEEKPIMVCPDCGGEMYGNERMYEVSDGYFVCESCFKTWLSYIPPFEFADKFGISYLKAGEIN